MQDLKNKNFKKPILIVIAGPNGSGKTSVTSKILEHEWIENCVYINPDNIAQNQFGDWNSRESVLKAAKLSEEMRHDCLKNNKSLIFETVLSMPDKINFIKKAKDQGYFVRLFFINTDSPTINAKRVAQRVMEGGHDVAISKIISRYAKSVANGCIASKIVDRSYFYDNSKDAVEPKLLFRTSEGKITKEYTQISNWALPVKSYIEK